MIRNAVIESHVVEYLKSPPSRALLVQLIARAGLTARERLREKGTLFAELSLGDPALSDDTLIDAMMVHPILINRPLVVSPLGVKLCRLSEAVLDLLPAPQRRTFNKEDGQVLLSMGPNDRFKGRQSETPRSATGALAKRQIRGSEETRLPRRGARKLPKTADH